MSVLGTCDHAMFMVIILTLRVICSLETAGVEVEKPVLLADTRLSGL